MSDNTIICDKCGERVPRKRFCFECGEALGVNQPVTTTQQEKISTPVQVADSVLLDAGANESRVGQNTDAVNKPPTSPTTTSSRIDSVPPSYAEAARSNVSDEGNTNGQQSSQRSLSNTKAPAGSVSSSEKFNVAVSRNDGTAANVKVELADTHAHVLHAVYISIGRLNSWVLCKWLSNE